MTAQDIKQARYSPKDNDLSLILLVLAILFAIMAIRTAPSWETQGIASQEQGLAILIGTVKDAARALFYFIFSSTFLICATIAFTKK